MSLVESLLEGLESFLRERDGHDRVLEVRVVVGALRQVVPEVLLFCYDAAVPGTLLEGSRLSIRSCPIRRRCARCGEEYETKDPFGPCTACGSERAELLGGMEFYIDSVEVETDGDDADPADAPGEGERPGPGGSDPGTAGPGGDRDDQPDRLSGIGQDDPA